MIPRKKEVELRPDYAGYPWQEVGSSAERWLILRQKKTMAFIDIEKVTGVEVSDNEWDMACDDEGSLLNGTVRVVAICQGTAFSEKDAEGCWPEDESLGKEYFMWVKEPSVQKRDEQKEEYQSGFSSLITDGNGIVPQKREETVNRQVLEVKLPWRTWLEGEEGDIKPIVSKIHVSQVGLSTVLVEVLLRLEKEKEDKEKEKTSTGCVSLPLPPEELMLVVKEGYIQEIIGVMENRAFSSCYTDEWAKELFLQNTRKTSLLFISSHKGGERFLTASCSIDTEDKLSWKQPVTLLPLSYHYENKAGGSVRLSSSKALCRNHFICTVTTEYERKKKKPSVESEVGKLTIQKEKEPASVQPVRKKPGERFLKKCKNDKKDMKKEFTVVKIKKE